MTATLYAHVSSSDNLQHVRGGLTRAILHTYRRATEEAVAAGMVWYDKAYETCERLGYKHGHRTVAAVVALAHLSPRMRWDKNVTVLERLLAGYGKPSAVLNRSWNAASRSLWVPSPLDTFGRRADKTRAFARAILGDDDAVVVDTWAAQAAGIDPVFLHSRTGYLLVEDAYRRGARRVSLTPRTLQAVTWTAFRGRAS